MKKEKLRKIIMLIFGLLICLILVNNKTNSYYDDYMVADMNLDVEIEYVSNEEKEEIKVWDNLTMDELTSKLNKNLYSTLSNTGSYFASYTEKTGLDPYLAISIVNLETGCKWGCSYLARECNNIGGIKGKPSCNGSSYKKYDTLEEGINGYLDLIYYGYYSVGLDTAEKMNTKYAEDKKWAEKVNRYYEEIRKS